MNEKKKIMSVRVNENDERNGKKKKNWSERTKDKIPWALFNCISRQLKWAFLLLWYTNIIMIFISFFSLLSSAKDLQKTHHQLELKINLLCSKWVLYFEFIDAWMALYIAIGIMKKMLKRQYRSQVSISRIRIKYLRIHWRMSHFLFFIFINFFFLSILSIMVTIKYWITFY